MDLEEIINSIDQEPYYREKEGVLYCADCMDILPQIPEKSIDLALTDPPYYRVMTTDYKGTNYNWDNQWNSFKEYINWCKGWFVELYRILKSNGSFYLFADDKNVSYLHIELEKLNFFLENHIVWVKRNNMTIKGWKNYRCYAPITERILFMSKEPRNTNLENPCYFKNIKNFSPIIGYMIEQKKKVKKILKFKTDKEFNDYINKITGTKSVVSKHYFTYSQWVFPTKEIYKKLQSINRDIKSKREKVFEKDYEVLKKEYNKLRKTFYPEKNFTDVWESNITSTIEATFHPTQKPMFLISRIIKTSSRKEDTVFDPFLGSGTTAVASKKLGRQWIGIEISQKYCDIAVKRLKKVRFGEDLRSSDITKWLK